MPDNGCAVVVKIDRHSELAFHGVCLADVVALNHDDRVRRIFRLYQRPEGFVAERIDSPDTIDVRYWGAECVDSLAVYEFFGNEPLANYLYGAVNLSVPGLQLAAR